MIEFILSVIVVGLAVALALFIASIPAPHP